MLLHIQQQSYADKKTRKSQWFGRRNKIRVWLRERPPVCLSPPRYLGEYALRRTLKEGAAGLV